MTEKAVSYSDKVWLKSYKLGPYKLEQTVEIPKVPLDSIVDSAASSYGDRTGIFFQDWTITYSDLKSTVDRLATGLKNLGVSQGDRVAIILTMCPQLLICSFAVWKAGGAIVLISPLLRPAEIEHELSEAQVKATICLDEAEPRTASLASILPIKDKLKIKDIIVTSGKDFSLDEEPGVKDIAGTINLRKLIEESAPEPPTLEINPSEDLALLTFTGGSTGVPKGVMHTHFSLMSMVVCGLPWSLKPLREGLWGKASALILMPVYHAAGFFIALQAFFMGLRVMLVPDPRDTGNIVKVIKENRPLVILAAPTQLMRLVQEKVGKLPSLVVSAGAPLPLEIEKAWREETRMPVTQAYGLSEGGMMINVAGFSKLTGFMPVEKHGLGVPAAGVEVKIVDPDTGKDVPLGEVGEICFSGSHVMVGYWPVRGSGIKEGWLHTGDVGRMDEDGYFYLEDRLKDMINVSGLKVYSVLVEEALFKHPSVAMAVAIGIPDPERPGSERVKAFIKLKDEHKERVTEDDITAICRENLPPYAVPKFIEFRDDLPMSAVEKLFKRALREEEMAKMKGGK